MSESGQFPYENAPITKFFHKKEGRWYVSILLENKKRTVKSLARYLMEVHLGRKLAPDEHVDHINNIKNDDRIENLQILTPTENNRKSAKQPKFIELICENCKSSFNRRARQIKKYSKFCSKKCHYAYMSNNKTSVLKFIGPKEIKHGTQNAYSYHRCRCILCRENHNERLKYFQKEKRKEKKQKLN